MALTSEPSVLGQNSDGSADLRYYDQPEIWPSGGSIDHPAEQARAERIVDEIVRLEPSRVVDVGAGNGIIANRLLAAGIDVVATDVSEEALRAVRGPAVVASAHSMPFEDGAFDLAVASEVLEHLPDAVLQRAQHELARVACRWVVLTVPNEEDLIAGAVTCPSCECRFHPFRHLQHFDPPRLSRIIPGFGPIAIAPIGPEERRVNRWEAVIRRDLLGRMPFWGPFAVCPQCGFRRMNGTAMQTLTRRRRSVLLSATRRRRARWLLAVLERGR
jgi:SAM-dependent methyltransferase